MKHDTMTCSLTVISLLIAFRDWLQTVSKYPFIRLLSKRRYFEEFLGAYEAQDHSVHVGHEDLSIRATQKLPKERMFQKKSIVNAVEILGM
ncbi:MAG: hypothetical protein LBG20_03760 [Holosporaceae bacterium]|nr:hypothetical protein [Holosporaceae bacterium]